MLTLSLPSTCTSSIYTTTYSQMNVEFDSSSIVSTIGLSTFVFGIGIGPAITSPLSETYGRRPIYLISWILFIISTIPSAVATNIETLIITRFFSGFFGGTFLSVSGGTASDIFLSSEIQKPMALVSASTFVGPSTGPLLGGFINSHLNWRWTYYIMIIWAHVLLVLMVFLVPETHHAVRLRAKAKHLRRQTEDDRYKAPIEMDASPLTFKTIIRSVSTPFQLLIYEPMCLCLNTYSAVLLGILYLFFVTFPLIFRTQYEMNLWQTGLTFLGIIVGMSLAAMTPAVWSNVQRRLARRNGKIEPEHRLPSAMLGGVLIPLGLFWFAWTATPDIHWLLCILGSGLFGCGSVHLLMIDHTVSGFRLGNNTTD